MVSIIRKNAKEAKKGRVIGLVFFGIFAVVGSVMSYAMSIRPAAKVIMAGNWTQAACRILSAEVESHRGDDSTTYKIKIVYQYEYNGSIYKSDRYDFMNMSSSGYKRKAEVVRKYQQEKKPVCFVNPQNPSEAVLKRGFHSGFFWALFPLPFAGIGIAGFVYIIRNWSKQKSGGKDWLPSPQPAGAEKRISFSSMPSGPVVLRSKSPWARLVFSMAIGAFWNGTLSFFLFDIVKEWQLGAWGLLRTLFFVPFAVIGIILIALFFICFLAMFNPRPILTLSSASVPLGGTAYLNWRFRGRTNMIRHLRILLKGIEAARYRRGTDTCTDENTFFQMEILSTQDKREIAFGEAGLVIPGDSMHSFEAENNKVIWEVEVQGVIDSWPDVQEKFKLTVTPAGME